MSFYIVKKFFGDKETEHYYTGLNDKDLEFSTEKSDAELFDNMEVCFCRYEPMRNKLMQEHNTEYYLIVDSTLGW
jgi:hypothetical protein